MSDYPKFVRSEQEQANFEALIAAKSLLIPYVGAGFSFSPNINDGACPSWGGFLWQLYQDHKQDMPVDEPSQFEAYYHQGQFELALQCMVNTIKIPKFQKIIEQTFNRPNQSNFPTSFKRKFDLFHQAFSGPWLTTNMDRFIEASFPNGAEQLTVIAGFKDPRLVSDLNRSNLVGYLFKLHGDAKDTNSLIFSHSDYVKAYGDEHSFDLNEPLPKVFERLFSNHSLLFIGCSLTIDRPLMILKQLANCEGVKDQFALLKRSDFFATDDNSDSEQIEAKKIARANLREMNITPIWLDDFNDIETVLEHLAPCISVSTQDFDAPTEPDIFVGRQQQLATLLDNINQVGSLCTIADSRQDERTSSQLHHFVGQGGVGKTTLARKVLAMSKGKFPDGCFEIRIDKMTPISFAKNLCEQLHLPEIIEYSSDEQAQAFISDILNQKRLLLLLDNVDSGEVLKNILPAKYQSCVIVTSRDTELSDLIRLNYPKVRVQHITLQEFNDDEALALFACMLGDKFDNELNHAYLSIAKQLNYLPIALRLSISTMLFGDRLTPFELLEQLEDNQQLKLSERATELAVNAKERSLMAVFDLSTPLLTDELKISLALIAVCEQGPVPEDFILALNQGYQAQLPQELLKKHLRTLERYHWCKRKTVNGEPFCELHQIVRQIVTTELIRKQLPLLISNIEKAQTSEDDTQIELEPDLERLFAHVIYCCFVEKPLHFSKLDRWIEQTDKAFLWFKQHEPKYAGYWVYDDFGDFCRNRGHNERLIRFCQWVIDISDCDEAFAYAYGYLALNLRDRGKLDEALSLFAKQLKIEKQIGNEIAIAANYLNQAVALKMQQKLEEALALLKRSEELYIELDEKRGLSNCYGNQAVVKHHQGLLDEAFKLYKAQERLCQEIDNQEGLSLTYGNQAVVLYEENKFNEALSLYTKQQQICEQLGNKPYLANCLWNQSIIFEHRNEFSEAISLREQAIELWQSCQLPTDDKQLELDSLKQYVIERPRIMVKRITTVVSFILIICSAIFYWL